MLLPKPQEFQNSDIWGCARPSEEIIHGRKDYHLPCLKVLLYEVKLGVYYSPHFYGIWNDDELSRWCDRRKYDAWNRPETFEHPHPMDGCHCGIYAATESDDLLPFKTNYPTYVFRDSSLFFEPHLCIVEPYQGADYILGTKGWRAERAFISEVVGQTITPEDASNLLSICWQRPVDVRRIYGHWERS